MKLTKWFEEHLEETAMGVFLVAITAIMFVQTILRNVFHTALPWPEELARYCLVGTTLLSFAYCIRRGNMLKLDIVVGFFPEKLRRIVLFLMEVVSMWLYWYLFTHAIDLLKGGLKSVQYSTAMKMPIYVIYAFAVVAFALALLRELQAIVKTGKAVAAAFKGGEEK